MIVTGELTLRLGCDWCGIRMIEDNLKFVTFQDFYDRHEYILERYEELSNEKKQIYKWYVYAKRNLDERTCDLIWEYLNPLSGWEWIVTKPMLEKECRRYKGR